MAEHKLELVLITGMSGSGKSIALHALEDAGYYCVDNLPPPLLLDFIALQRGEQSGRVAIAMDVRSAKGLPLVPGQLDQLRAKGIGVKTLFLDATTDTLVRRYSETRRKHPLSQADTLPGDERRALAALARGAEAAALEARGFSTGGGGATGSGTSVSTRRFMVEFLRAAIRAA